MFFAADFFLIPHPQSESSCERPETNGQLYHGHSHGQSCQQQHNHDSCVGKQARCGACAEMGRLEDLCSEEVLAVLNDRDS